MMKRIWMVVTVTWLGIGLFGFSNAEPQTRDQERGVNSYFRRQGYDQIIIPAGHYPAPGECRIWHPDRTPGEQPPPGSCERLRRTIPPGALLIRHPKDDPRHVHIIAFDEQRPGIVRAVGKVEIGSGELVRIIMDR